ncbi:MAG: FAD-binding protein [bacterium]
MSRPPAHHAIVIGSGLAGLCAARVARDHFEQVTVIERDPPPDGDGPRRGAPQGAHAHALMKGGERLFERLFPGFVAEIEALGAHCFDFGQNVRWLHHGVWKARFDSAFPVHVQTRPLVEGVVRARLAADPKISFRYGAAVEGLCLSGDRVTGVALRGAQGAREALAAELVIDAAGRGSRLPAWLEALGRTAPAEDRLNVDLCYATRLYEPPPGFEAPWKALLIYPEPPHQTRAGFLFPVEGGRWLVTAVGYVGDHAPVDEVGFNRYIADLPSDELARALAEAKPLGPVARYKFPYARQRRYDRLRDMPAGVIALGDAMCSFDPVFGQGMTMAARNAELLDAQLRRGPIAPRRWFRALFRLNRVPWMLAAAEGMRYPAVEGCRPPGLGPVQKYCRHVFRLCASDPFVYRRFIRVLQMVSGPEVLAHPRVVWAVLRAALGRGPAALPAPERGFELVEAGR